MASGGCAQWAGRRGSGLAWSAPVLALLAAGLLSGCSGPAIPIPPLQSASPIITTQQATKVVKEGWTKVRADARDQQVTRVTSAFGGPALTALTSLIERHDPASGVVREDLLSEDLQVTSIWAPRQTWYPASFLVVGRFKSDNSAYALLTFTKPRRSASWQGRALAFERESQHKPPEVAADGDGYFTPPSVKGLAVNPARLPKLYASYLMNGVEGHATGNRFASGPYTTDAIQGLAQTAEQATGQHVQVKETFSGGSVGPIFPLADGRMLVSFPVTRTEEATADDGYCLSFTDAGGMVPSGDYAISTLTESQSVFAAVPRGRGKVSIVGRQEDLVNVDSTPCA